MAQSVRAVRGHVQFVADVVHAEAHEGCAGRNAVIQHHDAGVVVAEADFVFGANHAEAFDAADLGLLHLQGAAIGEREFSANRGENHGLACGHVRGAAHNLERFLAVVHGGDVQVVAVRMGVAGENLRYNELLVAVRMGVAGENLRYNELLVDLARFFHAFDFEANRGERLCNFFRIFRKINVTSEPIQRNFHLSILLERIYAAFSNSAGKIEKRRVKRDASRPTMG